MLGKQKLRLLIVDDDPSIVKLLGRFAGELAFETLEAVRPSDALALASKQQVHVAVVDLHMPEMEGIELMKSLRQLNDQMQVILITGDHSSESVNEAIKNGACDYLWKPIDFHHLSHALNAARHQIMHVSTR
ncbi:MAG: response regulator [Acidobacteria bacterium]|nr:response regulator [Acidobacteriota bacterium]